MPPGDAILQAGRCSALAPATGSALFEQGSTAQNRKRKASSSPGSLLLFPEVGPRGYVHWASFFVRSIRLNLASAAAAPLFRRSPELSDSRRQQRWSARGASELTQCVERRSGAAVRSSDLVSPRHWRTETLQGPSPTLMWVTSVALSGSRTSTTLRAFRAAAPPPPLRVKSDE
jgi:hypothetical protein